MVSEPLIRAEIRQTLSPNNSRNKRFQRKLNTIYVQLGVMSINCIQLSLILLLAGVVRV